MTTSTNWETFGRLCFFSSLTYFVAIALLSDPALHYIAGPIMRSIRPVIVAIGDATTPTVQMVLRHVSGLIVVGTAWSIYLLPLLALRQFKARPALVSLITVLPTFVFHLLSANWNSFFSIRVALGHAVAWVVLMGIAKLMRRRSGEAAQSMPNNSFKPKPLRGSA